MNLACVYPNALAIRLIICIFLIINKHIIIRNHMIRFDKKVIRFFE